MSITTFLPYTSMKFTYLTLPTEWAAVANPLLNTRVRLVAASAERDVLNNLGRTMIFDYFVKVIC